MHDDVYVGLEEWIFNVMIRTDVMDETGRGAALVPCIVRMERIRIIEISNIPAKPSYWRRNHSQDIVHYLFWSHVFQYSGHGLHLATPLHAPLIFGRRDAYPM